MNRFLTYFEDHKPTFAEWLAQRHDTTSRELYEMFRQTGTRYGEYNKAMQYLRQQYHEEMAYRDALLASNPFTHDQE